MSQHYTSLLGHAQGAQRLHIHRTHIPDTSAHAPYQHQHRAEEVFYILEGSAEYRFADQHITAGPGDTVFIPSGILHAHITYLSPSITYLTIRTVEPEDEPCCCGGDRP